MSTTDASYARMIRDHFDAGARRGDTIATADYSSRSSFALRADLLASWIGAVEGIRILDVGCGNGLMSAALARRNRVLGIDFAPAMLRSAHARGIQGLLATAEELPLQDHAVELCLGIEVGQYLPRLDRMIGEMARVTRPGGHVLVSGLAASWARRARAVLKAPGPYNPCLHAPREIRRVMEEVGLTVIREAAWFQPTRFRLEGAVGSWFGQGMASSFALLGEVRSR